MKTDHLGCRPLCKMAALWNWAAVPAPGTGLQLRTLRPISERDFGMFVKERVRMNVKQSRDAQRVLDSLDRWDARFRRYVVERRRHQRVPYRTIVTVYVPQGGVETETFRKSVEVWARNLSQSGLCFVHPERLMIRDVAVALNSQSDRPAFFEAQITRVREVHEGFWEHAVVFVRRYSDSPATRPPRNELLTSAGVRPSRWLSSQSPDSTVAAAE